MHLLTCLEQQLWLLGRMRRRNCRRQLGLCVLPQQCLSYCASQKYGIGIDGSLVRPRGECLTYPSTGCVRNKEQLCSSFNLSYAGNTVWHQFKARCSGSSRFWCWSDFLEPQGSTRGRVFSSEVLFVSPNDLGESKFFLL